MCGRQAALFARAMADQEPLCRQTPTFRRSTSIAIPGPEQGLDFGGEATSGIRRNDEGRSLFFLNASLTGNALFDHVREPQAAAFRQRIGELGFGHSGEGVLTGIRIFVRESPGTAFPGGFQHLADHESFELLSGIMNLRGFRASARSAADGRNA